MFTESEIQRYSRQISIHEIGKEGQATWKKSSVLVVGAGGIGCPLLQYLAAAGIGTISIADGDTIDESNLHRQILFQANDIGKNKASSAAEKLRAINPYITIHEIPEHIVSGNAIGFFAKHDLIIDGSDRFATRYLVNDACVHSGKPFISGAIQKWIGQFGLFHYSNQKITSGSYRCLFPVPPTAEFQASCREGGVLNTVPGVVALHMANIALLTLAGWGGNFAGKFYNLNLKSNEWNEISFEPDHELMNEIQKMPLPTDHDYEIFCNNFKSDAEVQEISGNELRGWVDSGKKFQLIDVRTEAERKRNHIGGEWIPYEDLLADPSAIEKQVPVVLYCEAGLRSFYLIKRLAEKYSIKNLYNLRGGIRKISWAENEAQLIQGGLPV